MGEDRPGRGPQGRARLIELRPLDGLDPAVALLAETAAQEGHPFVRRLVDDWRDGINRFDLPGEVLLGAWLDDRLAGVGGLNLDPYANDPRVGRVRHVYVEPEARRSGLGRALIDRIVAAARGPFERVRLRTTTTEGAAFYAAVGFVPTDERDATHQLHSETAGKARRF